MSKEHRPCRLYSVVYILLTLCPMHALLCFSCANHQGIRVEVAGPAHVSTSATCGCAALQPMHAHLLGLPSSVGTGPRELECHPFHMHAAHSLECPSCKAKPTMVWPGSGPLYCQHQHHCIASNLHGVKAITVCRLLCQPCVVVTMLCACLASHWPAANKYSRAN